MPLSLTIDSDVGSSYTKLRSKTFRSTGPLFTLSSLTGFVFLLLSGGAIVAFVNRTRVKTMNKPNFNWNFIVNPIEMAIFLNRGN